MPQAIVAVKVAPIATARILRLPGPSRAYPNLSVPILRMNANVVVGQIQVK